MYGLDKLKTISYSPALFCEVGPSIGNTYSAQVNMEIFESNVNWPRMGKFDLRLRLVSEDGTQQSEWLTLGTFYTDERYYDDDEYLSILAYDGMLLTEQSWTDKITPPANWPITSKAWCTLIQNANLFNFASLADLDDTVALIGLDTTSTIRDVLKTIAAAHGGNWIMTGEKTLKLVNLTNSVVGDSAVVGIAVTGISVVGTSSSSSPADGRGYFGVDRECADFNKSDALQPISKVILSTDDDTYSEAGTDTGYAIKGKCNFATSDGTAALALSKLNGYIYKPFEATRVFLDPAAEPGDMVGIEGEVYQIMEMVWDINTWPSVDIRAQFEEEIDHEFTFETDAAKYYKKALNASSEALQNWIDGDFADTIDDITEQIDQKAETWYQATDPSVLWTTQPVKLEHKGDLWFRTTDNTTWYWNGTAWEQQDVPTEVFNKINGKAQVFVSQPVPPYNIGDLWVQGPNGDILKCNIAKTTGQTFDAADWGMASKYTDDSYIIQNANSIVLGVTESIYYSKDEVDTIQNSNTTQFEVTAQNITAVQTQVTEIGDEVNAIEYYVRYENGVVIVGRRDSEIDIRISNTQISVNFNGQPTSYWNIDKQYTPKQLQIPLGGSLQIGDMLFQPRSSGNLSLMYVGGQS